MTSRMELAEWAAGLPADAQIGIDEGGLTLRVVVAGELVEDVWFDIGGIPEEIENGGKG